MGYQLSQNTGECVNLPVLVLNRLTQATEGAVRTALYILQKGRADKEEIMSALGLTQAETDTALIFWLGAGLLVADEPSATLDSSAAIAPVLPQKRPPRISTREAAIAAQSNPEIKVLIEESQNLLGEILSPSDSSILVSLYLSDGVPVDLILIGLSHFLQEGKRNIRYIERRLLSWQREGITTCEAAERYLSTLAARQEKEKTVAALLEISPEAFTSAEKKHIANWYENFHFDDSMIEQGILRCGIHKDIKYLNGILRNWHAKGILTPNDIRDEPSNTAATTTTKHSEDDFVSKQMYKVPKFKKGDSEHGK